jgi:ligand-binding SRPBCC domain-containing protein
MLAAFRKTQFLPISLPEAWGFFSDPANLPSITPPGMAFRILSPVPERIHPGLILRYSVRPLPGYRTEWVSEITQARAPEYFVDEQRSGPYRFWRHEHFLRPVEGGVIAEDRVQYELPFGPLGYWVAGRLVRRRLEAIFAFRAQALRTRFGAVPV